MKHDDSFEEYRRRLMAEKERLDCEDVITVDLVDDEEEE